MILTKLFIFRLVVAARYATGFVRSIRRDDMAPIATDVDRLLSERESI
jgi:hypothetical protein